jgi:hypothetical protein
MEKVMNNKFKDSKLLMSDLTKEQQSDARECEPYIRCDTCSCRVNTSD